MTEDSQQISVAELLKRNGQSVESRGGRRRRGVAGGISVAELTGEIPIVRQSGSRAAAEPESAEPAASEPAASEPATAAPETAAPAEAVAETAKPTAPAPKVPADRTAAFAVSFDDDDDDDEPQAPKAESKPVATPPTTTPKPTSTPSPGQTSKSSPGQWVSRAPLNSSSPTQVTQEPALLSGQTLAGDLMRQERAATQSPSLRPPILPPRVPTPVAKTPAPAAPDDSTELIDRIADADSSEAESTAVVDLVKAPAVTDSAKKSTAVAEPETDVEAEPAAEEAGERNSIREWAVLAGQVVVALIVGGAMFKGFEKLWDMLPWVALVLALIVIVGLVAVVRVLRKTDDITSFVIAVVVGMIVTLGPLAFLLTSG
ncbi:hypothetical protein ACFWAD_29545 [Rhodococcus sp. NPDC059969]|uniref:hypothetical protein n=1 Tax=Rhodococcus sp. NPDC059969 TaxID=3347018 RepID=UPI00366FB065